jgi:hypothetical protein
LTSVQETEISGALEGPKALWKIPEDLGKEMFEDETEPS